MEMLLATEIKSQGAQSNMLAELMAFLSAQLQPMENMHLDEQEFGMIESILTLFAKVLKQDATMYTHLNDVFLRVAEMSEDGKLARIFEEALRRRGNAGRRSLLQVYLPANSGAHPLLSLLVCYLRALAPVDFRYSRKVIYHLIDALSALYDSDALHLKQQVVFELTQQKDYDYGEAQIVVFFTNVVLVQEESLKNYKVTEAFMRFLTKIFKRAYPLDCVDHEELMSMDRSFIFSALHRIYLSCMRGFFNMQFADGDAAGNFMTRAFKLTRVLLEHFSEVPQSQKAPLIEPTPRFDLMLEFLKDMLN